MRSPLLLIALMLPVTARAHDYDTYRADYFKGAFCTAIGGACAADDDLVSGLFQNPAALATGEPNWDFDGDYASRSLAEPGNVNGNYGAVDSSAVGGIGFSNGTWGAGLAFIWRRSKVDSPTSVTEDTGKKFSTRLSGNVYTTQLRLPVAYHFASGGSVGVTVNLDHEDQQLSVAEPTQSVQTQPSSTEVRFTVGGLLPLSKDLRIGSWFRFPVTLSDYIAFSSNRTGFVSVREDFSQHSPWIWAVGAAFEASPRWTLYAENDMIGPTPHGYLFNYAVFSAEPSPNSLIEKGRSIVFEPHVGARLKLGEKFRLHMGSYFENARWESARGRVHGTGGLSYQISDLFEIIAGADVATHYTQLFFTFR